MAGCLWHYQHQESRIKLCSVSAYTFSPTPRLCTTVVTELLVSVEVSWFQVLGPIMKFIFSCLSDCSCRHSLNEMQHRKCHPTCYSLNWLPTIYSEDTLTLEVLCNTQNSKKLQEITALMKKGWKITHIRSLPKLWIIEISCTRKYLSMRIIFLQFRINFALFYLIYFGNELAWRINALLMQKDSFLS